MPRGAMIAAYPVRVVGIASLAGALETPRTARGWVSAADTGNRTIKLKGKNDEVSFMLDDGGRVMEESCVVTFAEIRPGQHVMTATPGARPTGSPPRSTSLPADSWAHALARPGAGKFVANPAEPQGEESSLLLRARPYPPPPLQRSSPSALHSFASGGQLLTDPPRHTG